MMINSYECKSVGVLDTLIQLGGYSYGKLFQGYPPALLTFASIACVTFIFLGVPGNLITIIALARCKKVRNATAVFIINLSLSDLLFCCFNLPLAASTFWHREWIHGEIMCRLFPLLRYGLLAVSLFTVLTITINRYIMIGHPRIYPRIYRHKFLILMVAGTWLAAFGTLIPTWRGKWGRFGLDASIGSCTIIPENGSSPKEFLFLMAFVLPCFFIFICYARIFYIVRKTAMKSRDPHHPKTNGTARMTSNHNNNNNSNNNNNHQAPAVTNKIPHNPLPIKSLPEKSIKNGNRLSFQEDDDSENRLNDSYSERSRNSQNSSITNGQPANTSGASIMLAGRMTSKDRRLLKMILVIFISFLTCYLPITLTKIFRSLSNIHTLNIMGYLLVYLTTSINPIIYVVMSSEYRQAYWNLLMCRINNNARNGCTPAANGKHNRNSKKT
ncbi:unnamed protein product [Diamesa hyperborea]